MSLLKKYVSFSLLTITAIILFQGCQCSSRPDPNYSPFPVDGWGVKYFSTKDTPIESKKWAYYCRKAYYRNGKPDPDSLAVDHYYENSDQDSFFSEEYYESGRIRSKGKFVKTPDFATSHSYKPIGDFYYYDESGHRTIKNYDPKPIQPRVTLPMCIEVTKEVLLGKEVMLFCVRPARTCRTQNSQLTRKRKLRRMGLSFMDVRAMMTGVPSGREAGTDMFMKLLSGARSGMLYEYWATPTDTPAEIRLCSLPTPMLSPAIRLPKKPS